MFNWFVKGVNIFNVFFVMFCCLVLGKEFSVFMLCSLLVSLMSMVFVFFIVSKIMCNLLVLLILLVVLFLRVSLFSWLSFEIYKKGNKIIV